MNKIPGYIFLSKRQKFVAGTILLSIGIFISEYISGTNLIIFSIILSSVTTIIAYLSLREDIKDTFFYPILILPFFFTLSFSLFYPLIPSRFLSRIILTSIFGFGLYSLFLAENIFAVSTIRTITLLRSARIVAFVITIVVFFLLTNIIFAIRLPVYLSPMMIFATVFLLNFQSLWTYSLNREFLYETVFVSIMISIALTEISIILNLWPIDASIYSIFLTGIFYSYSGLAHAWFEKRLFRGILWEYVWVGFLSILILIVFSKWGL